MGARGWVYYVYVNVMEWNGMAGDYGRVEIKMYTSPFLSWDFNSIKEICDQNIFSYSQLRLSQSLFDISTNATISVLAYLVFCLFDPPSFHKW